MSSSRILRFALLFACSVGCRSTMPSESVVPCSPEWYRATEARVPTGDGDGHGPDLGSEEWKSVVEFKLGVRGRADLPTRDSEAWCREIDRLVAARGRKAAAPDR